MDKKINRNIIITSKNALPALKDMAIHSSQLFIVGETTAAALNDLKLEPVTVAANAGELANRIIDEFPTLKFTYLCGDHRRDELPDLLQQHKIECKEVIVYESDLVVKSFDRTFAAVLFYSPRGVYAFAKANKNKPQYSICIGETTATAARELFENVVVAKKQTVENVLVTAINLLRNDKK